MPLPAEPISPAPGKASLKLTLEGDEEMVQCVGYLPCKPED